MHMYCQDHTAQGRSNNNIAPVTTTITESRDQDFLVTSLNCNNKGGGGGRRSRGGRAIVKLGRFTDALRSYDGRLVCMVEDKLRNDDDDNDDDDWDAASDNEHHRRPSLLPIQSHLSSLSLNFFIMDNLIPLFIACLHYCQICGHAPCSPPSKLAAVAKEVEVENGGGCRPRREEWRREIRMVEHNTSFYTHFCMTGK